MVCRTCLESRAKRESEARAFRCGACPKGADGKGPSFTDVSHVSESQKEHDWKKGKAHRPVVCRACHDARTGAKQFEYSACPPKKDGSKPAFADGGHLSKDQKNNFFKRRNPVVCAKWFKAGRAPRREAPKRPAETSDERGDKRRKLRGL